MIIMNSQLYHSIDIARKYCYYNAQAVSQLQKDSLSHLQGLTAAIEVLPNPQPSRFSLG